MNYFVGFGDSESIQLSQWDTSYLSIQYSNIQGGEGAIQNGLNSTVNFGEGNIDEDPLFCNPDSGDFTLAENSPCVGTGQDGTNMGAFDVGCGTVSIDDEITPTQFILYQNFPNPFNPITTIRFNIGVGGALLRHPTLTIYDITGRVVDVLVNGILEPGHHVVQWDASHISSGVYFSELVSGQNRQVRKMILLK